MTTRAALILAGGKARRFQLKQEEWRDKALAELFGKPLLVHVAENASGIVDEIVVCVNDEARKNQYADALEKHHVGGVKLVVDEKISHISGPNVAIMTGLKAASADFCVTLPCDMPLIKPKIVKYLFDASEGAQITVPMWPNGRIETLVMGLERVSALEVTETLCRLRRPRSDDVVRGAEEVLFVSPVGEMRSFDPELRSFVNINRQDDLSKLQTRPAKGSITRNFKATLGALMVPQLRRLQEAAALSYEHNFKEASTAFSACAAELEKQHQSPFWAGISRENEAETLLAWAQRQETPENAAELDCEGKDAFLAAAENYRWEAKMHFAGQCRFLAERAWADKAWCESWVMGKAGHIERYPPKY
ncbi:MAG: molybdenum cofactor guanylyltransferase [Candidatus Bathyarchaeota archaeon]|nr:molybdenum cofactor guanylyltransferase [Candidatus Bathyarchaeota archaeon]